MQLSLLSTCLYNHFGCETRPILRIASSVLSNVKVTQVRALSDLSQEHTVDWFKYLNSD